MAITTHLDRHYINLISSRLEGFGWKKGHLANSRCPLCGDSKSNIHKKRLFLYERDGRYVAHCHNCSYHNSFQMFLKEIDQRLYEEYIVESFGKKEPEIQQKKVEKQFDLKPGAFKLLQKVSYLDKDHPCLDYVKQRKIPTERWTDLYFCQNFMTWVNFTVPNKFDAKALKYDSGRLVIPFYNKEGKIHAFTGRALEADPVRYILIVLDETIPSVYGLDRVNFNYWTYVTEGPIDAMFVDNCLATCGGNMIEKLHQFPKDKLRLVFDNEPSSKDTIKRIRSAIRQGFNVVIWPKKQPGKDLNEMVQDYHILPQDIMKTLEENTYCGPKAELTLATWSKL